MTNTRGEEKREKEREEKKVAGNLSSLPMREWSVRLFKWIQEKTPWIAPSLSHTPLLPIQLTHFMSASTVSPVENVVVTGLRFTILLLLLHHSHTNAAVLCSWAERGDKKKRKKEKKIRKPCPLFAQSVNWRRRVEEEEGRRKNFLASDCLPLLRVHTKKTWYWRRSGEPSINGSRKGAPQMKRWLFLSLLFSPLAPAQHFFSLFTPLYSSEFCLNLYSAASFV